MVIGSAHRTKAANVTTTHFALLLAATTAFIAAASSAKAWALSANSWIWLGVTLGLYTIGNLIILRLVREIGMGPAFSLSALIQLVAINTLAIVVFGERLTLTQGMGIVLAMVAFAMITLPAGGR